MAEPPRTELDLVRQWLFAAPEELARPERPRSAGADGAVTLDQHPGVAQEIDAAVSWAIEEVTVRRTPMTTHLTAEGTVPVGGRR